MEGELWNAVYRTVVEIAKPYPHQYVQYSDAVIVLVFLWAVWNDRPVSWACRSEHWPSSQRDWPKPSPPTMSRRLRSGRVDPLMREVRQSLEGSLPDSGFCWLDGKALPVGNCSKDPDAGYGRVARGFARGYKLHVVWDAGGAIRAWDVRSLRVSEQAVAKQLIAQVSGNGFVLADANYDANRLYEVAGQHGWQLLAHRRYRHAQGVGHHRHSVWRLHALRMLQDGVGPPLLKSRQGIERRFGNLVCFAGGLQGLPPWVRRVHRVKLWIQGKLIFNACRILKNKGLAA